jgi:hypothetical protein
VEITPNPTADEAAAIAAVVAVVQQEQLAAAAAAAATNDAGSVDQWVAASRRAAQGAGMQRGPWRLSGRVHRRSRA